MISKDKQYRTRDGREVRIYATDAGGYWPVHGAIQLPCSGGWLPMSWDNDGNAFNAGARDNIIEVRPRHKRTVWLNVYDRHTFLYDNRKDADSMRDDDRIACIKVDLDFEEGKGL